MIAGKPIRTPIRPVRPGTTVAIHNRQRAMRSLRSACIARSNSLLPSLLSIMSLFSSARRHLEPGSGFPSISLVVISGVGTSSTHQTDDSSRPFSVGPTRCPLLPQNSEQMSGCGALEVYHQVPSCYPQQVVALTLQDDRGSFPL
jgi:hypothetical protein